MASLRDAQRAIVAALAQHASYAYRASSTVVNQLNREIDLLGKELAAKLYPILDGLSAAEKEAFLAGQYHTKALKALDAEIEQHARRLDEVIQAIWASSALELARYEAVYIAEVMNHAVDGLKKIKPDPSAILKKASERPVFGGELLDRLLVQSVERNKAQVYSAIRQGFADGQTNSEVIRALRGTETLKHQDGLMHQSKVEVERVVRTARNHIGNTAYEDVYEKLGVTYVVVVATLDGRTSKYCAAMDGTRYKVGEAYPRPPYHPHCRSVLAPSMDGDLVGNRPFVRSLKVRGGYKIGEDGERIPLQPQFRPIGKMTKAQREKVGLKVGQVKAGTNYSKWFSNQDAAFQQEWLGPKRYKLYKEGGYDLNRFVDPRGRQYTLEELRQRDAETFRSVFGE